MSRASAFLIAVKDAFLERVVEWIAQDTHIEIVGLAHSGSEALERLDSLRVDIVLADVTLPDMSGFEVARRIKSRRGAPLLVLLSFHDSHAARLEAWAAGADGFVAKPQTANCLIPLVGDLLRQRNASVREESPGIPTRPVPPAKVSE